MKISPSRDLGYWVGVVQSDGCLRKYIGKSRRRLRFIVSLRVGKKSLPMLEEFQRVSNTLFNRRVSVFKERKVDMWGYYLSANTLIPIFKRLNITFRGQPIPPEWSLEDESIFGAYLAGLIDGDGDIRVKRKQYPQCVVRISDGFRQTKLANSIRSVLHCSVSITHREGYKEIEGRRFYGHVFELEFYVSSKNYKFVKRYIIPHLTLKYKKERIENYINSRWPR